MNSLRAIGDRRGRVRVFLREGHPAIGFIVQFFLWVGGLFFLLMVLDERVSPIGLDLDGFNRILAGLSGSFLNLMGAGTKTLGDIIAANRFSFRIDPSCTGVWVTVIYLSAVLAYPAKMRERLFAVFIGILVLQAVNLLRIIGLFYTRLWFPEHFQGAHIYGAEVLVISFAGALWLLWAGRLPHPARS